MRTFIAFDDGLYVFENPRVLQGLSAAGVRWAFTTFHAANWHPLTWLSHMLDVSSSAWTPGGHHLTSVAAPRGQRGAAASWRCCG